MPISQKSLDFLVENRFLDNRDWFTAHKKQYRELVVAPLAELVEALAPAMLDIDPQIITEPKVDRTISRIYRDTRFSKDKFLYRDVAWIVFARKKQPYYGPPSYFMEYSPRGFRYGCGFYQARPKTMETLREMVLSNVASFRKARVAFEEQTLFILDGESYKRSRFPDQPPAVQTWLNKKNIFFVHDGHDFNELFAADFYKKLEYGFRVLAPVYHFMMEVETRAPAEDYKSFHK